MDNIFGGAEREQEDAGVEAVVGVVGLTAGGESSKDFGRCEAADADDRVAEGRRVDRLRQGAPGVADAGIEDTRAGGEVGVAETAPARGEEPRAGDAEPDELLDRVCEHGGVEGVEAVVVGPDDTGVERGLGGEIMEAALKEPCEVDGLVGRGDVDDVAEPICDCWILWAGKENEAGEVLVVARGIEEPTADEVDRAGIGEEPS